MPDKTDSQRRQNGEVYVTYKWLIATFLVVVGLTLTIVISFSNNISKKIDCKVDKDVFTVHLDSLQKTDKEIKDGQSKIMTNLEVIHDNQIRTMQKLYIPKEEQKKGFESK